MGSHNKWIWEAVEINIFMWQLLRNVALTRDKMLRRKWLGLLLYILLVIKLKQQIICSLLVTWLDLFGV
jgi:hypothetical protein